jgi:hypothetical protein
MISQGHCVANAIKVTNCASANTHCICAHESFMDSLGSCTSKRCGKQDKEGKSTSSLWAFHRGSN